MARNLVPLNQVISDFVITLDEDDYVSSVGDTTIRTLALRGIREMGFDLSKKVKSLKLLVEDNDTVLLPDDFVDMVKIGVVGDDGLVYIFAQNKNISASFKYATDVNGNTYDSDNDGVRDTVEDKTPTSGNSVTGSTKVDNHVESYVFQNFIHENGGGRLYGIGGAHHVGEYKINYDQNRIEIGKQHPFSEVVLEYIADEARSKNPSIHVYLEEALRNYIYYKLVERKASVPANEKARARQEYYNELRKARARMGNFSKEEALNTIRKNFTQSPKY